MTRPRESLDRAKLDSNLTKRELRRTAGSWMAIQGASLLVIGKAVGHRDIRSTQVYARLSHDPERDAVNSAAAATELANNQK
jgi:site-specific recombinase XerD